MTLFAAHKSLESLVPKMFPNQIMFQEFSSEEWFRELGIEEKREIYCVVIMPAILFAKAKTWPAFVGERIQIGTLRIVVIGEGVAAQVPATFIPSECSENVRNALVSNIIRFSGLGLQSVLPVETKILMARVSNEDQVLGKVDQAIELIVKEQPGFKNKTLEFRFALMSMFTGALAAAFKSGLKKSVPFQVGVSKNSVAFSLRWSVQKCDPSEWSNVEIPWLIAFNSCHASWIQMVPAKSELEAIFLFALDGTPLKRSGALVVDVVTSQRAALTSDLSNETSRFKFDVFGSHDIKSVQDEHTVDINLLPPTPLAKSKEVPPANDAGALLKLENLKLEGLCATQKEQIATLSKKLSATMDAEKAAIAELRAKQLSIGSSGELANLKQEVETLKKRLDSAKEKEMELIKKLSQAVEQMKKLKSSTGRETRQAK